jgi:hypothetical protein
MVSEKRILRRISEHKERKSNRKLQSALTFCALIRWSNQRRLYARVRQGDPLSALLFNLTLESAIRNLEIRGNTTTKLKQMNAYADDTVITARTQKDLIQTFEVLERESIKLGLKVNETKTKYMHLTRNKKTIHELKIGE